MKEYEKLFILWNYSLHQKYMTWGNKQIIYLKMKKIRKIHLITNRVVQI